MAQVISSNYHVSPTQLVPSRLLFRDAGHRWLTNCITTLLPRLEDGLLGENVIQKSQRRNSVIGRDCISADVEFCLLLRS
ncbi:uncharacterized [Tachysurus ichikawai]